MMKLTKSIFIAFMVGYHFRSTASQTEKSAPISGNVTFDCRLCNSTCERVHWRKKNITVYTFNVETNNTDKNEDKQRYRSSNDGSRFMITEIEKSDEGNYSCKVSAHEHILEQDFYLHVPVTDQERGTSPAVPTTPTIVSPPATSPHFDKRGLIIPSVIVPVIIVIIIIIIIIIVIICILKRKRSPCGSRKKPGSNSTQTNTYAPVRRTSDSEGDDAIIELHTYGDSSDKPEEDLNVSHALVRGNCPPGSSDCNDHPLMLPQNSTTSSGLDPSHSARSASSTLSFYTCHNGSQGDDTRRPEEVSNGSHASVLSPAESNLPILLKWVLDFPRHSGASTTTSLSWNYSEVVSPQGTTTTLTVSSHQGTPSSVPNPDSTQVSIPQGTISRYTVSSQQGTLTPSSVPNPDCTQTQQTKSKLSPVGPVLLDDLCHLHSVLSSEKIMQLKRDMRKKLHLLVEECKGEGRSPRSSRNLKAVTEYVKSGKRDFPECVQEDVGYFLDELDLIPDGRKRDVFEVLLTMPENQQGYDKSKWCANKFLEPDQQDHQESTIGQETDSGSRRKQLIGEMVFQLTSSKTKSERDAARNNISRIILRALSGHTISGYSKPASMIEQEINTQSDYDQEIEDHNLISFWMSKVLKFKGTLQKNVLDQLRELDQDPQSACQDGAEKRSTKKDYMENVTGNKINRNTKQEDTEMAPKKEILNSYKPKNDFPTSEG